MVKYSNEAPLLSSPLLYLLFPQMIKEKLGHSPTRTVRFFSFSQGKDSVLNTPGGRKILRDVGIQFSLGVGEWLVKTFHKHLDQEELASRLHDYIHKDEDSQKSSGAAATPE